MSDILHQLGVDHTFFIEFAIFIVLFNLIPALFFKPFLKLFQERHQKTVKDKLKAESLSQKSSEKMDEYKNRLAGEKQKIRNAYEAVISQAKNEENTLLNQARSQARKITQETTEQLNQQSSSLKKTLANDVESLASQISETLMKRT